jgi:hypothetical protein
VINLAEENVDSEEGLCCVEFRRISLTKVLSLCIGVFTEESQFYFLQRQKSFTAQRQDRV